MGRGQWARLDPGCPHSCVLIRQAPSMARASHGQLGSKMASVFPLHPRVFGQPTPNMSKADNESFVGGGTTA